MPWFIELYVYGFWLVLILAVVVAWRRGDAPLKGAALLYLAATVAEFVSRQWEAAPWREFNFAFVSIDTALLIGLLALAFRFDRRWLIISASLQLISVLGHIMRAVHPHILPLTYAILTGSNGYLCLAILITATLFERRE